MAFSETDLAVLSTDVKAEAVPMDEDLNVWVLVTNTNNEQYENELKYYMKYNTIIPWFAAHHFPDMILWKGHLPPTRFLATAIDWTMQKPLRNSNLPPCFFHGCTESAISKLHNTSLQCCN